MLEIHHAPNTRGFRAIWLCEELSLPYRVVAVPMAGAYRTSPEWRRMNPVGKLPVMVDDTLVMFESGAMVQYLLDRYGNGNLQPASGSPAHGHYLQWSWFAEATYARPLGEIVNHRRACPGAEVPAAIAEMKARAASCAAAVDQALQGRAFLLGESFTAADIMMGYTLRIHQLLASDVPLPPNLARYWASLTQRPAYQAADKADQGAAPV
ncbi:MAG: glutathione S-transferase family protein [Burkholderiaceae bacterium]